MIDTTIVVERREQTGTGPNRRLRQQGNIPAVVYGADRDPVAIAVPERVVQKLLRDAGENAVFKLQLEGGAQSRNAMVRDIQYEATTGKLVHIDFLRVRMDEVVHVSVPIELDGTPTGVKNNGGLLDFITRELEVECLPDRIPAHLSYDVSEMDIGDVIESTDLELPEGVTFVEEEARVIAAVNMPKITEETEEGEEEGLLEAEAEQPERVGEEDGSDAD